MSSLNNSNPDTYRLVITHYLFSAMFFVILAFGMTLVSADFGGHYFNPRILALTHLAALGWGTLIIFGAVYQLLPVVLECELYSSKLGWMSITLFVPGTLILCYSFWIFAPGVYMQMGAVLLLCSISLFCINVILTARHSRKRNDIQRDYIISSCLWLLATATLGTLLVFNFRYAFLPKDHLNFLRLHAHMGIAGWFLLLIIGVSSRLVPMFLVSRVQQTKLLEYSYYLINIALIFFIVDGYVQGLNAKTYVIVSIMFGGLLSYARYMYLCYTSRIKRKIDLPIANTILSVVLLFVCVLTLVTILIRHHHDDAIKFSMLYGNLVFMGWISSLILGQAFKTFPFIVWVKKYQHLVGKGKNPLPADLVNEKLFKLQTASFVLFVATEILATFLNSVALHLIASASLVICSVSYTINLLIILKHQPVRSVTKNN